MATRGDRADMAGEIRLEVDGLAVVAAPARGFTITGIQDQASGAEALWSRTGFQPAEPRRELGPSGDGSIESFGDRFIGGWFEMFPTTGFPGTVQGPSGPVRSLLHGEVMRLPWVVTGRGPRHVEASVETIRTPLRLTRRLEIERGELVVSERAENLSDVSVPYTWGHHPCFARATFAGGRLELSVETAETPGPVLDPANNRLLVTSRFDFPFAPRLDGGTRDVADIPSEADGRHEQTVLRLRNGGLRITAPRFGRAFRLDWDVADLPYALVWQDYLAPDAAFWGTCDTFAVEPSSGPGRSLDDAVAAGMVRRLGPRGQAGITLRAHWESA